MTTDRIVEGWTDFDVEGISEEHRPSFLQRRRAVEMYLIDKKRPKEISGETGIRATKLKKYVDKAESLDEDGNPWGYRALVPYAVRLAYTRRTTEDAEALEGKGKAGLFEQLLEEHPDNLRKWLTDLFLNGVKLPNGKYKRVRRNEIPMRFLARCTELGISHTAYPFTSDSKAERSVYRFLKSIEEKNQVKVIEDIYGSAVAVAFETDSIGSSIWKPTRLFERVQLDGHRLDALGVVEIPTPSGNPIYIPLYDVWVLTLITREPPIALGHAICLTGNYNRYDVMRCVASAMGIRFAHDGIADFLPVHFLPELAWIAFDDIEVDRALAHRAMEVGEVLYNTFNSRVRFGEAHTPKKRPHVEQFYSELESRGIARLPSALKRGDRKKSNREEALKQALLHKITINDLEEMVRRSYFDALHKSKIRLSGGSQIEYLRWYLTECGDGLRRVPQVLQNRASVMRIVGKATVVGNPKDGKRPCLNWYYGEYRGPVISQSTAFLGKELTLVGDPDDIRVLRAYLDDQLIDTVEVQSPWSMRPHSWETRRRAGAEFRRRKISLHRLLDAVTIYENMLVHRNTETPSRKSAKELSRLQREAEANKDNSQFVPTEEADRPLPEPVIPIRSGRKAIIL